MPTGTRGRPPESCAAPPTAPSWSTASKPAACISASSWSTAALPPSPMPPPPCSRNTHATALPAPASRRRLRRSCQEASQARAACGRRDAGGAGPSCGPHDSTAARAVKCSVCAAAGGRAVRRPCRRGTPVADANDTSPEERLTVQRTSTPPPPPPLLLRCSRRGDGMATSTSADRSYLSMPPAAPPPPPTSPVCAARNAAAAISIRAAAGHTARPATMWSCRYAPRVVDSATENSTVAAAASAPRAVCGGVSEPTRTLALASIACCGASTQWRVRRHGRRAVAPPHPSADADPPTTWRPGSAPLPPAEDPCAAVGANSTCALVPWNANALTPHNAPSAPPPPPLLLLLQRAPPPAANAWRAPGQPAGCRGKAHTASAESASATWWLTDVRWLVGGARACSSMCCACSSPSAPDAGSACPNHVLDGASSRGAGDAPAASAPAAPPPAPPAPLALDRRAGAVQRQRNHSGGVCAPAAGAAAVSAAAADVPDAMHRRPHHVLLSGTVGRGQAAAAAVLVDRRADQQRKRWSRRARASALSAAMTTMATCQHKHSDRLCAHVAVGALVQRLAAALGRQHARLLEHGTCVGVQDVVDSAQERMPVARQQRIPHHA
eukprot:363266-Chlamydomonas_euryale.AAC.2